MLNSEIYSCGAAHTTSVAFVVHDDDNDRESDESVFCALLSRQPVGANPDILGISFMQFPYFRLT